MQMRVTLRARGAPARDLELRAPSGTTVADITALLHEAVEAAPGGSAGLVNRIGASVRRSGSTSEVPAPSGLWIGSRALPPDADLVHAGLRAGSVVGVGEPSPRERDRHEAVRLHVVSGPDAGRVEPIARGRLRIGRDRGCHVRLNDPDVSRQHAELIVTPSGISVRDLGSSNGTTIQSASAGPTAVDGTGRELALNSYLTLGETTVCVTGVGSPPAVTTVGTDGAVLVKRPPRLDPAPPKRLDLPPDPAPEGRAATPWVAALIPALGGVGLAWFLHSPQFLAFALLSPVILLATALSDRVSGGRLRRRNSAAARRRRAAAVAAVAGLAEDEAAFRRRAHPDPACLLVTATTPDARLWERRRADADFLQVRVGLGDAPARAVIRVGSDVIAPVVLPAVPAVVALRDGPLGICGPRPLALPLARWVIGQLAILHSPAELNLTALLADDTDGDWEWLRWLPHSRTASGELRLARSPEHRQRLMSQLSARLDAGADTGPGAPADPTPWTVVLVDRYCTVPEVSGLSGDAVRSAAARITCVYLDGDTRRLPPGCVTIAQLSGETGSRVRIRSPGVRGDEPATASDAPSVAPARRAATDSRAGPVKAPDPVADRVGEHWCDQVSRALAPLMDPGADQAGELPASVRARDLFALPNLTANAIRARWAKAAGRAVTPIGIGPDGPVDIDLGRDGPHALIAGTTGAGKSELLQTLVAGLALNSPPTELQFVLIDYKGGAAFGDCARLPHTVGMVTDLDAQLTERALRSLDAELRRRETLFVRAGAVDLGAYRRASPRAAEPVGRLVLVIDEFASLAEELPDFVSGLVGIAQRGRSLGVHLVLATQRPGGAVSPEIRANTALRIALRVTDQNESNDVIGSDLASRIDRQQPGRAVVRAGQALFPVQIARIATAVTVDHADVQVIPLDRWGSPLTTRAAEPDHQRTDLADVVDATRRAWHANPVRLRRPWLDPLPTRLDVAAIARPSTAHAGPGVPGAGCRKEVAPKPSEIVLGLVDRPGEQTQVPFTLDLHEPSTMVFAGGPRSGRTSLLRAAALNAARQLRAEELHVYAIDGSGAGLKALTDLPHCGAVVGRDAPAAIAALVGRLSRELDRRQHGGGEVGPGGGSEHDAGRAEPALLLLLDGWEGFLAAVEDLDAGRTVDTFVHLLRDGVAAGLSVIVTGDRGALAARLSSAVQHRYVLRLSDPADYALAGLSRRQLPAAIPPGRAIDTADGSEIQLAIFGLDPSPQSQNQAVAQLVADAAGLERRRPSARAPFRIRALPTRVGLSDLAGGSGPQRVVLGLGGDSGEPLTIRAGAGVSGPGLRFLVAGPPRSGRSTVLRTIAVQLALARLPVVAVGGPRSPFIATAGELGVPTLDPDAEPEVARRELEDRLVEGRAVTLLIDDTELFTDTAIGEHLSGLIRRAPRGLDVVATGRSDDLALAFRGIAAEVKRARTGLLLQPGPGDGDLFGLRLPYHRWPTPPGRGLLIASDEDLDAAGAAAVPLQVALP